MLREVQGRMRTPEREKSRSPCLSRWSEPKVRVSVRCRVQFLARRSLARRSLVFRSCWVNRSAFADWLKPMDFVWTFLLIKVCRSVVSHALGKVTNERIFYEKMLTAVQLSLHRNQSVPELQGTVLLFSSFQMRLQTITQTHAQPVFRCNCYSKWSISQLAPFGLLSELVCGHFWTDRT